jgi:hypothetical protein
MKLNKYLIAGLIAVAIAVAVGVLQPVRENLTIKYKPYTGLDYPNQGDTGSLENGTVAKCKAKCTKKPDCIGFTIHPNKTCYFKDTTIRNPGYTEGTFYYGGKKALPPGVTDPTEYENIEWTEEEEEPLEEEVEEEEEVMEDGAPTTKRKNNVDADMPTDTGSNVGMYVGIGVAVLAVVLIGGAAFVFLKPPPAPLVAGRRR